MRRFLLFSFVRLNQEISQFHQIKLRQRALSESEALTDGCWVFPKLLALRVFCFFFLLS